MANIVVVEYVEDAVGYGVVANSGGYDVMQKYM